MAIYVEISCVCVWYSKMLLPLPLSMPFDQFAYEIVTKSKLPTISNFVERYRECLCVCVRDHRKI